MVGYDILYLITFKNYAAVRYVLGWGFWLGLNGTDHLQIEQLGGTFA